jgi:hypothetical protein
MNNIVPFEHQRTLAASLVKSGLFGLKDEAQALALMALCEAEGMHPAQAIRDYHIVQGRPAMKADAMLARFQRAGGSVHWPQYTDERVVGVFSHPQGGSVSIEWSIERAKRANLANKDVWKHYPRNMLRARCISEGVRAVYPGIAVGIYTPEELQDMPAHQVRDMGNVEVLPIVWTDELQASAAEAASQGMSAYTAWWKAQSDEFRTVAVKTATHADMKALAAGKAAA